MKPRTEVISNTIFLRHNQKLRKLSRFPRNALEICKNRALYRFHKVLKANCLPKGWHSIIFIFLQKKISKKLYLCWSIHQYSTRNIKASKNNIESYVQIKDMPNLLPVKEKTQIKSYGLVIKKMQQAQRIKKLLPL